MATQCLASLHLCRTRVTRLDAVGNPVGGANNSYVSDKPISLGVTPEIEAGGDQTLVGGCDCIVASYRGRDKLKWFNLELATAQLEAEMWEILLGATIVADGGNTVGNWFQNQLSCDADQAPFVCFEGWADAWEDDHQFTDLPYIHWIWPGTYWQLGPFSLENDFAQPQLNGFSRGNPNWGLGIYADLPEAALPMGGWLATDTLPDAFCGYQTQPLT